MGFQQYQGPSCIALIIHLMGKEAESVSITKLCCLQKFYQHTFFKNVLILKYLSETKQADSFIFIDLQVNLRMNFMTLSETWILMTPVGIYMFKVNDRDIRKWCEICLKLTIKTPERRRSGVFIVNFEHISHLALVFQL